MAATRSPWPFPSLTVSSDMSQYDLRPFASAPAVIQRAKETGGVMRPIYIPGTSIPSPLAQNLSPDQLVGLKELLIGRGLDTTSPTGNGHEIWLSWKRAWDIWNNNYIHGRMNPTWVKEEFKRRVRLERNDGFGREGQMFDVGVASPEDNWAAAGEPDFDENSSCGGYRALKDFPEFKAPPPLDPEVGDDGIVWDDLINNSVWRPRRARERTVQIGLDVDPDEFLRNSDLERDRGVDCGRLPYPVLRPLIQYIQLKDGAFVKKKVWDGVTRTIFNMPTPPLQSSQCPEEERLTTIRLMFGGSHRELKPVSANQDIFPLDIRRVTRIHPRPLIPRNIPPLLENTRDKLLYDRHSLTNESPFKYRNMSKEDPWYFAKEQMTLIDYPPRRYPPPEQNYKPEIIPVDDTIFREEFDSDQLNFTRYFVTNLHSGTLIINGVEVRKGDIAGPLPKFAVIECPGGQIAFWFGSYGRNHLAGNYGDSPAKWLALRQQIGWKYTGLSAGQVWMAKIMDRINRKKAGDNEHDDKQWEEWLSTKSPIESSITTSVTYRLPLPGLKQDNELPLPGNITQPHVIFPSERHEISWVTAQRIYQISQGDAMDIDMVPGEEQFFPGSQSRSDYIEDKVLTQERVDNIWMPVQEFQQELQQALVDSIRDKGEQPRVGEEKLTDFKSTSKRNSEIAVESKPKKLKTAAEDLQYEEEVLDRELHQVLEQDLEMELCGDKHRQMQREWNDYTKRARQIQRERLEGEQWKKDEDCQAKNNKQKGASQKVKLILYNKSKLDDHPQVFNDKSNEINLVGHRDEELLAAIERSKKEYRDNIEQNFVQNAILESKTVPEYLKEQGFSSMEEYLHVAAGILPPSPRPPAPPTAPVVKFTEAKQQDLRSYLKSLKQAYIQGTNARARLINVTLKQYVNDSGFRDLTAYVDFRVQQVNVTEDNIPDRITDDMSWAEEATARAKWSNLCDRVIEANDFESQTQAATRWPEKHTAANGRSYVVL